MPITCSRTTATGAPCRNPSRQGDCGRHTVPVKSTPAYRLAELQAAHAQAMAADPMAAPAGTGPQVTGRFGNYGPHEDMSYGDAMGLLKATSHVVSRHDTPYGSPGTAIDAEVWDDGDTPVLSVTITYDDHGAEVRAWRAEDTYPSSEALVRFRQLAADRTGTKAA